MNQLPSSSGVGLGVTENTHHTRKLMPTQFSLDFRPITKEDRIIDRTDLFEVSRPFTITSSFSSRYDASASKKKIFTLRGGPDCMANYTRIFRFYDYGYFVKMSKYNKMLNFLVKCCPQLPLVFELSFKNPGVAIPFFIDYNKYMELCGGDTLFYDYQEMEGFKEYLTEKFDLIAIRKERKKLREGE